MNIFIDTSAFYALLDRNDENHNSAQNIWKRLLEDDEAFFVTSNYVIIETTALTQNRIGIEVVKDFQDNLMPIINIEWIAQPVHDAATAALFTANRRQLSLVDCVSFEVCRRLKVTNVFAFDKHFNEQGFSLLQP